MDAPADVYDVAVIGGGVVGCAIALELSRYSMRTVLLEARSDVGSVTSKANSAILHTGFDAVHGSLEADLVRRGYQRYHELSDALGLPISRSGALVVAWTDEQVAALPAIEAKARQNAVSDVRMLELQELRGLEPHLSHDAQAALLVPGESITCPFTPVIAFATNAVLNGARLLVDFPVHAIERTSEAVMLRGSGGQVQARIVVNAAGLRSDDVDRLFGKTRFSIRPRKGEFLIFDKPASRLARHILLPVPTARTKGVLITRTVFGNLLLGPTAIDVDNKEDFSVSAASIRHLLDSGIRMLPELRTEEVTCTYAGLRAATEHHDFQIHFYPAERYVTVGGIRSTGLSASLGIAEYVVRNLLTRFRLDTRIKHDWKAHSAPPITELAPRVCESETRIAANRNYGAIVCHCERVSQGEIADALCSTVPARDLDGVKRRTRATLGRCQGFNCYARISAMVADHASS